MAKIETIKIGELNNMTISVRKDIWTNFLQELETEEKDQKERLIVIKEIIEYFTQSDSAASKRFKNLFGRGNIEYLIEQLLINRDSFKDLDTIKEFQHLLYNSKILVALSHGEIFINLDDFPILENTKIPQILILCELSFSNANCCIMQCEEISRFTKKDELFGNLDEYKILKRRFNNLFSSLKRSYASLDDDDKHEDAACKGTLYRIWGSIYELNHYNNNFSIFEPANRKDDTFSKYINYFFQNLGSLTKEHLYIYNYILSDEYFLYRARGLQDACDLLKLLSEIKDFEGLKKELIRSFFDHSRIIDKVYCPNYELFMMFLKIASKASDSELEELYDYIFKDASNFISLDDIKVIIYNILIDFPGIYNVEMLINQSIEDWNRSDKPNNINEFLNILLENIKRYSDIPFVDLKAFKAGLMGSLQDISYKKRYITLFECIEIIKNGGNLTDYIKKLIKDSGNHARKRTK